MCCFFTVLVFLGPRVAAIIWWLVAPLRWVGDTAVSAFNSIIWPILGIIFLPWTTLMYVIVAPGGVVGLDWLWVILAVVIDIASFGGGAFGNRDRIGM
jgi:hypothetical protein